jgi:protein phosphatase
MSDDTHRLGRPEPNLSDAPTGQIRAPGSLAVEAAGRTDKGRVRPGNEDAFGFEPPASSQARAHGTLLIVSDGMGGHAAGEVASRLAVETVQATYYRERGVSIAESVRSAIIEANSAIFNNAEQDATRTGMGCTIVVMVVQGSTLTVGHVGDSRGYLIRGGQARQITRDHSWVAMQVEEGVLTPAQAEHHPNRSLLMRALGRQPSVEVEIGQHQLQAGDVLLLCSDGLTGVVNDAEIGDYASRYAPTTAADQLVNLANQRGAPDNVTVLAAAITAAVGGAGVVSSAATTVIAPAADALTPKLSPPADSAATVPMSRSAPATGASKAGAPIVLSRESMPPGTGAPGTGRRGRGRWLAGSLAAFGLAAGLVLLTVLGPRAAGDADPPRVAEAPAASKPAATPPGSGQAAPAAAVPPPMATGLPGLTPPGPAVAAAPPPPAATSDPAIVGNPATTPLIPGGVAGLLATPTSVPTATATQTATPTPSGADDSPPAGADASADAAVPSDAAAGEPSPDPGDPPVAEEGAPPAEEGVPPAEAGASAAPSDQQPAPAPGNQSTPGSRVGPGSGVSVPGLPGRPGRRLGDD